MPIHWNQNILGNMFIWNKLSTETRWVACQVANPYSHLQASLQSPGRLQERQELLRLVGSLALQQPTCCIAPTVLFLESFGEHVPAQGLCNIGSNPKYHTLGTILEFLPVKRFQYLNFCKSKCYNIHYQSCTFKLSTWCLWQVSELPGAIGFAKSHPSKDLMTTHGKFGSFY